MKMFKNLAIVFVLLAAFFSAAPAWSQTSNTALVLGTVTDPGGAVVPDASAQLTNIATNEAKSVTTNSSGQYAFPNVAPGTYTLKIAKAGFATITFPNIRLDVSKSYTYDAKLEVSSGKEIVEVSAGAAAELQTVDAVVGNVVGENELMTLPTLGRDSRELLTLQPMSTPFEPTGTGFGNRGGTIAGARSDQNAFNLDGIDITDNVIAGGGNQVPVIPISVETVSEFRVGVTNNNASFERAEGGQINLITKTGTNDYHGAVYWYHQNSALNANTWDNGHTPNGSGLKYTPKQPQHDNRGGGTFGGPLKKNKTFVFGNYELRRFPQAVEVERVVPTPSLRNGILTFSGVQYNLATSTACGAGGNLPCDPRGVGISPTIKQLWSMMPLPNDPNVGDGSNTEGFRTSVPEALKDDFVNFRLDHNFTDKVKFFGHYFYHRDLTPNSSGEFTGQVSFLGGSAASSSASQIRGDGFTSGLDWQIQDNLINTLHVGWIRSRQDFNVIRPRVSATDLNLPGTQTSLGDIALAPGLGASGLIDTVVDVDTQRARHQAIYDSNKQYADNLTWVKGKHSLVTGADIRWLPTIHDRDDKVIGSVNSLVATLDSNESGAGTLAIPQADRPAALAVANQSNWDRLYAATLGLVNNVGILAVRDGNLNPKPLGASLIAKTTLRAYDFFVQDSWRLTPSFTLTYGVGYGWQTTPHEQNQQQTFIANHDAGDTIISGIQYIQQKQADAEAGNIFNPTLSYIPIKNSGRSDVFNVDYGDWAPRASAAWNPSFPDGFLHRIFGDRKTVIRGGYGIAYDRVNTVQSVIIPMLGVGFAQTINVTSPLCNATGAGGSGCNPSVPLSGAGANPGLSSFRVGVDGTIPTPALPGSLTSPIIPSTPFGEILSFQNDPNFKAGRAHMVDFTIQRSLPGQMILELGYVGRFGRDLPGSINFNSAPYMFKDKASGQIFAQAFDAVATQLRAGASPLSVTLQPWFENQLPGLGTGCGPVDPVTMKATNISSTACLASGNAVNFINDNLSSLFNSIDVDRKFVLGLQPYDNLQVLDLFMRDSHDRSNYNAFVVTLRNNSWRGLAFDMNYTFSKSLDTVGAVQNAAEYHSSSFNFNLDYGPSFFNRPHVFNAIYHYDLPFGGSHRLTSSNAFVSRVIGGWYSAGILRIESGIPELVSVSSQSFGGGDIFGISAGMLPTVPVGSLGGSSVHAGVCSSGAGSGGNGPNCTGGGTGTGLNYFPNPGAAIKDFRQVLLATDTNDGRNSPLPGLPFWNLDMSLGKTTTITERFKVVFSADFFNLFNHVNYLDPSFDITNPSSFGVINTQLIPADRIQGSRWIQLGLRFKF